jgi:hypothetical protein
MLINGKEKQGSVRRDPLLAERSQLMKSAERTQSKKRQNEAKNRKDLGRQS